MAANHISLRVGKGVVHSVEFSPYQRSCSLLAIGGSSQIMIKACNLKEPSLQSGCSLLQSLEFDPVLDVLYGASGSGRVTHVSWSPATAYDGEDSVKLHFCAAGSDHKIKVFSSDFNDTKSERLEGHGSSINGLACHPTDPTLLASVGADCVCRLWDLNVGQLRSEFRLGSPGMSVRWHPQDPLKLLVAENGGRVRFYDITTATPIMSLDAPSPPLMAVDWAPTNSLKVGGVANGNWCLWDIARSSQPQEVKTAHHRAAVKFRWCAQSDSVFATIGYAVQVKVHHTGHQKVPISCDLPVANGLSWHTRLPVLAVGSDHCVELWSVET